MAAHPGKNGENENTILRGILFLYPDTPWDCHICRSIGVVPGGSIDRQSYGSPMGRVWV